MEEEEVMDEGRATSGVSAEAAPERETSSRANGAVQDKKQQLKRKLAEIQAEIAKVKKEAIANGNIVGMADGHIMPKPCMALLRSLMTHRFGFPFNEPVDPEKLGIRDYFTVIKNPMDLGTIKKKLEGGQYSNSEQFASDVRLVWSNAILYNPPHNDVHKWAVTLSEEFEKKWPKTRQSIAGEAKKLERSASTPKASGLAIQIPAKKQERPVAREGPMSTEDKEALIEKLQQVQEHMPEKLEQVIALVAKRHPELVGEDGEVELDVNVLEDATLWELDKYVSGCLRKEARPAKIKSTGTPRSRPLADIMADDAAALQSEGLSAPAAPLSPDSLSSDSESGSSSSE